MLITPVSGALAVKYIRQVALGGRTLRSETFIVALMVVTFRTVVARYLMLMISTADGSGPTASRPPSSAEAEPVPCARAGPGGMACGVAPPLGGGVAPGTANG